MRSARSLRSGADRRASLGSRSVLVYADSVATCTLFGMQRIKAMLTLECPFRARRSPLGAILSSTTALGSGRTTAGTPSQSGTLPMDIPRWEAGTRRSKRSPRSCVGTLRRVRCAHADNIVASIAVWKSLVSFPGRFHVFRRVGALRGQVQVQSAFSFVPQVGDKFQMHAPDTDKTRETIFKELFYMEDLDGHGALARSLTSCSLCS